MRVLLCGHRSFAAQGLLEALRSAGHDVTTFGRGPVGQSGNAVTGPVDQIDANPHLVGHLDTVINYIVLKDHPVDPNIDYIKSLLRFCEKATVGHLIHISSISSYRSSVRFVDEQSEIETVPLRKGPYGSLKAATDLHLMRHCPKSLKISFVRPGFILGPTVDNPIIGTAARLPSNKLLVIGNGRSILPVISRETVNAAVIKLVNEPPAQTESLLLCSPDSPTRVEFLEACCRDLGMGTGVVRFHPALWWMVAVGSEVAARLIGQGQLKPFNKLSARIPLQRFNPAQSQRRLGLDFRVDWRPLLRQSIEGQKPNFDLNELALPADSAARDSMSRSNNVTFVGFGRIVQQKHLPALKRLGFGGKVVAYDPHPRPSGNGVQIEPIQGAQFKNSDLFVIASPGPAHTAAIEQLQPAQGAVLVEKPLCYTSGELARWEEFGLQRTRTLAVCHNYRFKKNVLEMIRFLQQYNAGRLRHVSIDFQSPSVSADSAAWLRDERRARTLLMDYSLHFLDLACMFCTKPWAVQGIRHELNSSGQTSLIEGRLESDYSVAFCLRQGLAPRRARIWFAFQNYSVSLGFFPETFVPHMSNDNPWLHKREAKASRRATIRKVFDKLLNRDSDHSHALAYSAVMACEDGNACSLSLPGLRSFYTAMFEISRQVYGPDPQ